MITKSVRSRLCVFPERPSKSHEIKRNYTLTLLYTAPTVADIHICRRRVSLLKHRIQVIQNRRRPTFLLFYSCIPIYICFVLTLYDMTRVTVCEVTEAVLASCIGLKGNQYALRCKVHIVNTPKTNLLSYLS